MLLELLEGRHGILFPGAHVKEYKELEKVAPNVLALSMGCLKAPMVYATGNPTSCAGCRAIFSVYSKSHVTQEATGTYWSCEFCGALTKLPLDPQEYPTSETATYVLHAAPQAAIEEAQATEGITTIFCIDVRASMKARNYLPGMPKQNKYMTQTNEISRLDVMKKLIETHIQKLAKENPRAKVGFVTFANDVCLIGDGSQAPYIIPRRSFGNFDSLFELTGNVYDRYMSQPVATAKPALLQKLAEIRAEGGTALRPGVVVGVALAARGPAGSRVIICTDGISNRGLGQIRTGTREGTEEAEKTHKFYNHVKEYAQQHGIMLSVILYTECEYTIHLRTPLATLATEKVLCINPMRSHVNLLACLAEKVLATRVNIRVQLHPALMFVRVPEAALSADRTVYTQQMGCVTRDSRLIFEYGLNSHSALAARNDPDLRTPKAFPLQVQIEFKEPSGRKCVQVITQIQELAEKAEEEKTHTNSIAPRAASVEALGEAIVNMRPWSQCAPDAKYRTSYERSAAGFTRPVARQQKAPSGKAAGQLDVFTISPDQQRAVPTSMAKRAEEMMDVKISTVPAPKSAVPQPSQKPMLQQFPMQLPIQQSKTKK